MPFVAAKCGGTKEEETKIQQTHRAEVKQIQLRQHLQL
ncbi:hypothetical protein [Mycoplasmopsis agalactiae]